VSDGVADLAILAGDADVSPGCDRITDCLAADECSGRAGVLLGPAGSRAAPSGAAGEGAASAPPAVGMTAPTGSAGGPTAPIDSDDEGSAGLALARARARRTAPSRFAGVDGGAPGRACVADACFATSFRAVGSACAGSDVRDRASAAFALAVAPAVGVAATLD
jgi:hypothetical protein